MCDLCKSGNYFGGLDRGWNGSAQHIFLLQWTCLRKLPFANLRSQMAKDFSCQGLMVQTESPNIIYIKS